MPENAADTAPLLREWMTGSEVASAMDVTRQHVNRMFNRGDFETLHRLGTILVVRRDEVEDYLAQRAEARQRQEAGA